VSLVTQTFTIVKTAAEKGIFPGGVCGIWFQGKRFVIGAGFKALTPFLEPVESEDIFDLASLTKPLGLILTTYFAANNIASLNLFSPLEEYLKLSKSSPYSKLPVYRLLNHTSGLPAWAPLYEKLLTLDEREKRLWLLKKLLDTPPAYPPGEKAVYSDLGYFLFTLLLEAFYEVSFEELFSQAKTLIRFSKNAFFDFLPLKRGVDQEKIAPTSVCPWSRRLLRGIVEDENTRALGGVSGVAGLFANIHGVLDVLEFLINEYQKSIRPLPLKTFLEMKDPNSEYRLGFMELSKEEKANLKGLVSDLTLRHTGFTGTSFLVDFKTGLAVVLLTNRVHPTRENTEIRGFRHYFHSKVVPLVLKGLN